MHFPEFKDWASAFAAKKPGEAKPCGVARLVAAVTWMAALASVATLVFLFVLPSPHVDEETPRTCGPYISTPGFPHWDIVIFEGNPLEVFCVLDMNHDNGRDHNATDLRFYRNGTLVEPKYLTVVNETTLRYFVEKSSPLKAMLFCNLKPRTKDKEIFVCLNMITVKPDYRLYDILRIILGVAVLLGVTGLGIWFARRFYKVCQATGNLPVKAQPNMLPGEKTKDPGFHRIMWIPHDFDTDDSNSRSADKQERLLQDEENCRCTCAVSSSTCLQAVTPS